MSWHVSALRVVDVLAIGGSLSLHEHGDLVSESRASMGLLAGVYRLKKMSTVIAAVTLGVLILSRLLLFYRIKTITQG